MKEIAAMAEPHYVAVSPHNFNSTVLAQAATVHVAATMPNFLIAECFVAFLEQGRQVARQLEIKTVTSRCPRRRASVWRSMKQRLPSTLTSNSTSAPFVPTGTKVRNVGRSFVHQAESKWKYRNSHARHSWQPQSISRLRRSRSRITRPDRYVSSCRIRPAVPRT